MGAGRRGVRRQKPEGCPFIRSFGVTFADSTWVGEIRSESRETELLTPNGGLLRSFFLHPFGQASSKAQVCCIANIVNPRQRGGFSRASSNGRLGAVLPDYAVSGAHGPTEIDPRKSASLTTGVIRLCAGNPGKRKGYSSVRHRKKWAKADTCPWSGPESAEKDHQMVEQGLAQCWQTVFRVQRLREIDAFESPAPSVVVSGWDTKSAHGLSVVGSRVSLHPFFAVR